MSLCNMLEEALIFNGYCLQDTSIDISDIGSSLFSPDSSNASEASSSCSTPCPTPQPLTPSSTPEPREVSAMIYETKKMLICSPLSVYKEYK